MKLTVLLTLAALSTGPAAAMILYDAFPCTPGIDCIFGSHGTSSGSGPANADFQNFFAAQLGFDTSSDVFTWSESSNANGYYFGHVDDHQFAIHTAYLWNGSTLLCCTLDDPYAITDGNDHNLFIGDDPYGVSNAGQFLYPAFLAMPGGPYGLPPADYALTPPAMALIGDNWWSVQFEAIDNGDRILARWDGPTGWLVLVPEFKACCSAPEPATALLLAPLLAGVVARRRRKAPLAPALPRA